MCQNGITSAMLSGAQYTGAEQSPGKDAAPSRRSARDTDRLSAAGGTGGDSQSAFAARSSPEAARALPCAPPDRLAARNGASVAPAIGRPHAAKKQDAIVSALPGRSLACSGASQDETGSHAFASHDPRRWGVSTGGLAARRSGLISCPRTGRESHRLRYSHLLRTARPALSQPTT